MFERKTKGAARPLPPAGKSGPAGLSFIGPEVTVSGDIATQAQLHVDGRVEGDVRCAGLCQGSTGAISGSIVADQARLAGLVEGTVTADTLVLEETARITGDVHYATISVAAGAQVDGRLSRRSGVAAEPPALIATVTDARELFPADAKPAAAAGR